MLFAPGLDVDSIGIFRLAKISRDAYFQQGCLLVSGAGLDAQTERA